MLNCFHLNIYSISLIALYLYQYVTLLVIAQKRPSWCATYIKRGILYYEQQKCYVSAHFRYLLTTFVLIRNILIASTTSCVSIFDISNDILFSSLSFCYLYMTKKTSDLPLYAKKHPYFRFESRSVFALWLTCYYISARIRRCLN